MNLRRHRGQMSEALLTASFIILSGGLQDAYTYLCRGKVFANAQTGNIVLFSAYLFDGEWGHCVRYLIPVIPSKKIFQRFPPLFQFVLINRFHIPQFPFEYWITNSNINVLVVGLSFPAVFTDSARP